MLTNKATYIIAEVAQAHDGSLGLAHSYIDALASTGVDAIKFQAHYASCESTLDEPFRIKGSGQDSSRFEYWKRMEFDIDQWVELKQHCDDLSLDFLCSPFSIYAVDMLNLIGMRSWKIGSGEALSHTLLDHICSLSPEHLIVSTGMMSWTEVDSLVDYLNNSNSLYSLLHCVSLYPTPLESVGFNIINELRQRYSCSVGFSDHTGVLNAAYAALSLDIDIYEAHVCFDQRQYGPDSSSSLTINEFSQLVDFKHDLQRINSVTLSKNDLPDSVLSSRKLFTKSLALNDDFPAGTVLTKSILTLKKPSFGIPYGMIQDVLGKRLMVDWSANKLLKWEVLE